MSTKCFSFAPRDSVPGLIAKICKYLKDHPGWSEEDLKDEIANLVHDAGVQSFNGRTGNVVLSSEDVNELKIATAYFGEGDETIDELDIKALYAAGIRFVFTDFNSVTPSYNNSYVLDYFPGSDDIAYYPISTSGGGGGAVTSVNGKNGDVTINLADVLGASGAQVKLCTDTEFTANTIEDWNAYYEDGYRIVGVVNDGATAVDYLYLLKQDENNHQPIEFGSGSGTGAVDSVNGKTGVVTIGEAGVVEEESEATQYMQVFVDESQDYEPITNANRLNGKPADEYMLKTDTAPDSEKLGGQLPKYYMKDFGRDELLWEGSWSSGDLEVPSTQDYMIYRINMGGQGTAVLAIRLSNYIRGIGGYSPYKTSVMTYHFTATVVGDRWTFVACNNMRHIPGAAHSEASGLTVTGIYGIC